MYFTECAQVFCSCLISIAWSTTIQGPNEMLIINLNDFIWNWQIHCLPSSNCINFRLLISHYVRFGRRIHLFHWINLWEFIAHSISTDFNGINERRQIRKLNISSIHLQNALNASAECFKINEIKLPPFFYFFHPTCQFFCLVFAYFRQSIRNRL